MDDVKIKCSTGFSNHPEIDIAVKEACDEAQKSLGKERPKFAIIYFTAVYNLTQLEISLNKYLANIPNVGSSGEGVIGEKSAAEGEEFGVSISLFTGNDIKLSGSIFEGLAKNDFAIGDKIARWVNKKSGTKALILLPDGINVQYSKLEEGIHKGLPFYKKLPIFGGLSSDNLELVKTYQIHNGKVYTNSVAALSIGGKVKLSHTVNHGCVTNSKKHIVTKVVNDRIYEIDFRPAFDVIKENCFIDERDEWGRTSINLCVAIKAPQSFQETYDDYLIRFMVERNEDEGWLRLSSSVLENDEIWIARRDIDKIDEGIINMGESLNKRLHKKQVHYVFQFDCGGRGRVILENDHKMRNLNYLQNEVAAGKPWAGFYTYGEIAPVAGINCFHSYTAVLLCLHD